MNDNTNNPFFGLSRLNEVPLEGPFLQHYEFGLAKCQASGFYPSRMKKEFRDYLALAQVSGRIRPCDVNFEGTFKIQFLLKARYPYRDLSQEVRVADHALLVLAYPEEAIRQPVNGTSFVQIIGGNAFHPNISPAALGLPVQGLCLGSSVMAGVRLKELILIVYGLLTLQSITMDMLDPAGVLDPEAAEYWQQNIQRIPLSREPFIVS